MGGIPRHDKAWAQQQVQRFGGRPHRASILALILGLDEDAWREWGREGQEQRLARFVLEGEHIRFAKQTGEAFIVSDAMGGMGRSESADRSIDELKAEKAALAVWTEAENKIRRDATQKAYAQATIAMAPEYVKLEQLVLEKALDPKATPADRRMAMAAWKDWKDRHMGKAVAPTEDVTQNQSNIREWMSREQPSVLPLSAGWTMESVAEDQLRELEAGTLEGAE